MPAGPHVEVRRGAERFRTEIAGISSWHGFSAGAHYDPENTSFGPLLAHDEHVLQPGHGFASHQHRGLEIVTWVLEGALTHEDSTGAAGVLTAGLVQCTSSGSGVVHSERNAGAVPVRFVQAWLLTDDPDAEPAYAQADVSSALTSGGLVEVASGRARNGRPRDVPRTGAPVPVRCRNAAMHVSRPAAGSDVVLPEAPLLHLYLARGSALLEGAGQLGPGDAVRISGGGGRRVTPSEPAELLVWALSAPPRP